MIVFVGHRYYADMEKQVCVLQQTLKPSSKNYTDIAASHPDACFMWRRFAKYVGVRTCIG
jgi:hypothetical protein